MVVRQWFEFMRRGRRERLDQLGRRTSAGRVSMEGPRAALKTTSLNGVVTTETVTIAPAAHLVVTEGVSNTATLGAGKLVVVQWEGPQASSKDKNETLRDIQPVVGVS